MHGNARLTEEQIKDIRLRYASGTKQRELVQLFGLCQSTISKTVRGMAHKMVAGPVSLRNCVDCGAPLDRSKRRCELCRQQWQHDYFQSWYQANRKGRRRKNSEL